MTKKCLGNNRSRIGRRLRRLSLQARWFISLEMRVIPAKKEALQALSISKNLAWNTLTFRCEEIDKSIKQHPRHSYESEDQSLSTRRSVL